MVLSSHGSGVWLGYQRPLPWHIVKDSCSMPAAATGWVLVTTPKGCIIVTQSKLLEQTHSTPSTFFKV